MLGDILERSGGEFHFCGHTHARAKDKIGNTSTINLGSDYNLLRYTILRINKPETKVEEIEVSII